MTAIVGYFRDESLNVEALTILDSASGDVLEIQRALQFDDQDVALGLDTYCLVRGGLTHYGGVLAWKLNRGTLTFTLDLEAAKVLQLPDDISIPISPGGLPLIESQLGRLLGAARDDER